MLDEWNIPLRHVQQKIAKFSRLSRQQNDSKEIRSIFRTPLKI